MATPKVSFSDLAEAFQNSSYQHHYWLDQQTGRVILIDDEVADVLREGEDLSELPAWQREVAEEIKPVLRALGELPGEEAGDDAESERYVEIPQDESRDGYEDMTDFAETVTNAHLRELLEVALRGKGAFRRFKDVLLAYPAERERWFAFRDERLRGRIKEWAADEGVTIDFAADATVAQAAEKEQPGAAITLYQALAEAALERRSRGAYQEAVGYLKRAWKLAEQLDGGKNWQGYLQHLRARYPTLRALQEELTKARL